MNAIRAGFPNYEQLPILLSDNRSKIVVPYSSRADRRALSSSRTEATREWFFELFSSQHATTIRIVCLVSIPLLDLNGLCSIDRKRLPLIIKLFLTFAVPKSHDGQNY